MYEIKLLMNDVKFWLSWRTAGYREQIENFMSLTSDRAADVLEPVPFSFIRLNPLKTWNLTLFHPIATIIHTLP